jgi:2-oxo-4-hydroxy-4-carboxy-5-ureidoimidazoline decarboxylase
VTLEDVNGLSREAFTAALGWIFEDSPWVAERAWSARPFDSVNALHNAMTGVVREASREEQLALLRAHPDLGTRTQMSAASAAEQTGSGLDRLTPAELERLRGLNAVYRERFGFPFLYAVKGSTERDILSALARRVENTQEEEFRQALWEVGRIAWFRLNDTFPED